MGTDFNLYEPDPSLYSQELVDAARDYSDVAVVVISRTSGEASDLSMDMVSYEGSEAATGEDNYHYVDYVEGIYVGYRYYETAAGHQALRQASHNILYTVANSHAMASAADGQNLVATLLVVADVVIAALAVLHFVRRHRKMTRWVAAGRPRLLRSKAAPPQRSRPRKAARS